MQIKKLPLIYQLYGFIIRNIFEFRWKSRFRNPLLKFIQEKNKESKYYCYIKFGGGIKIRLDLYEWVSQLMFIWGEIERDATACFRELLKPGMVFIDIGANIGYYSLIASKLVGPSGKVFAFEPWSRNINILKENIKLNSISNITIVPKALSNAGSDDVKIFLPKEDNCGMASLVKINDEYYSGDFERTSAVTFADFLESYKPGRIDVVKIDVEGSEMNVLKGMAGSLADKNFNPVILIELIDFTLSQFSTSVKDVIDYMAGFGFKAYKINSSAKITEKNDYEEDPNLCYFKRV